MSFSVIYQNAIKYKGDVLVNSLGKNGAEYGALCKEIINGINLKYIKGQIDSKRDMEYGYMFETDGGDLPVGHVLHIVTPMAKDDKDNIALYNAYKSVIEFAISKGYKKIGIPLIGAGYNGYSEGESYDTLLKVLEEVSEKEEELENNGNKLKKEIINASIIIYRKSDTKKDYKSIDKKEKIYRKYFGNGFNQSRIDFNGRISDEIKNEHSFLRVMDFVSDINPHDIFSPKFTSADKRSYAHPYDFVEDYCIQKDLPVKTLREYDSHKRNKIHDNKTLSKIDVYRFSILLNLNKTEIIQFMSLCGHGFNPTSDLDMFFMDYVEGKFGSFGKWKKLYEMDLLYNEVVGGKVKFVP